MSSIKRGLAITGVVGVLSLTGYSLWFDYQRRNHAEFRKNLKQRVKKQKAQAAKDEANAKRLKVTKVLDYLTGELAKDPIPSDPAQMETIFTTNVELGEGLSRVPGNEMQAAAKFYKALAVYPNPADLLGIYQRTIPDDIYEYIVIMIAVVPPTNITSFINGATEEEVEEQPIISEIETDEVVPERVDEETGIKEDTVESKGEEVPGDSETNDDKQE